MQLGAGRVERAGARLLRFPLLLVSAGSPGEEVEWGRARGGAGGKGKKWGGGSCPGPHTPLGMALPLAVGAAHGKAGQGIGLVARAGAATYAARSCLGHHETRGNLVPQIS